MNERPLPSTVKPEKLLREQSVLQGVVPLENEPRLDGVVLASGRRMSASMWAARDDEGRLRLRGRFEASVEASCQVCLQPVRLTLKGEFDWLLVHGDTQAKAWWKDAEPVWIEDGEVAVTEALVDELLLSLPIAPCHDATEACDQRDLLPQDESVTQISDEGMRENPFAGLKKLLDD
jgi:uncharacterized protein